MVCNSSRPRTCLASFWHLQSSPSLNPAVRWSKLSLGDALRWRLPPISHQFYWVAASSRLFFICLRHAQGGDGDGFSLAKHVPDRCSVRECKKVAQSGRLSHHPLFLNRRFFGDDFDILVVGYFRAAVIHLHPPDRQSGVFNLGPLYLGPCFIRHSDVIKRNE